MNAAVDPDTTRVELPPTARMMVLASRIERLAAIAAERLEVGADEDALAAALGDIAEIRLLCKGAMR